MIIKNNIEQEAFIHIRGKLQVLSMEKELSRKNCPQVWISPYRAIC